MTCRFLDQVLLLDSARFSADAARALEVHADGCAECGPALAQLRNARGVLAAAAERPAAADARAVVWAGVEAQLARREVGSIGLLGPRSMAALAAFATAAVAWFVFQRPADRAPPEEEATPLAVVNTPPEEAIEREERSTGTPIPRGRVHANTGARWRSADDGAMTRIALDEGAIDVELDDFAPAEIVTSHARIRVVGGRASVVRAPKQIEVHAKRGSLEVWIRGRALPITVSEGQSFVVPPAEESAAIERRRPSRENLREASPVQETPLPQKTNDAPEKTADHDRSTAEDTTPAITETKRELKTARAVIETDAPRAAEIAERVLSRSPPAELEAEALAVLADAERRRGYLDAAAASYAKLRDHPRGQGYAEEAMLQRALLFEKLQLPNAALSELARLQSSHPRGVSAPERAALAAKIYLAKNDPRRAAQVILDAHFEGYSRALENRRAEVARALEEIDPQLAEKLMKASDASSDHSSEANR